MARDKTRAINGGHTRVGGPGGQKLLKTFPDTGFGSYGGIQASQVSSCGEHRWLTASNCHTLRSAIAFMSTPCSPQDAPR